MPDETRDAPVPPADGPTGGPAGTRTHDPGPTAPSPDDVPTRVTGPGGPATYDPADPTGHAPPLPVGDDTPAVPGYEILGELGRGGMGVVYHARDTRLNREVALKMILRADPGRAAVARFWAEAEVMAAVRHPHVVQVFELGEAAGRPFMATELVPGGSLADRLKSAGPLPPRAAAELLERTARGVAAAHDLGIVHRDLKPGNVLLAADGTPKVADFGLAKRGAIDLTQTQILMGTPAYMAPEQAAGRAKFVGPQADVWALGVILYECVAGGRPFAGETVQALLSQIQSAEPMALRTRVRAVPRDLDTVVSRCLAKEPEHRYPTAAELADDLARFVRGEPITARPVGRVERFARWVRRKPTAAAAYGFSALAAVLAAVVFVVAGFWREAVGAKADAEAARDRLGGEQKLTEAARVEAVRLHGLADAARRGEEAAKKEVAFLNYAHAVDLAYQLVRANDVARARTLLAECPAEFRGWEWGFVHRLCHQDRVTLRGHAGRVLSAAFSPDGTRVVTASEDHTARVYDAATGEELAGLRGHAAWVSSAAFSADGEHVLTSSGDNTARVWDARTGRERVVLRGHANSVRSASFSPDGTRVLTTAMDDTVRVWDAGTGRELAAVRGGTGFLMGKGSVPLSPDGKRVVTVSEEGDKSTARVWDIGTGRELAVLEGHRTAGLPTPVPGICAAAFSPDGRVVVTAGGDGTARLWDAATGRQLRALAGHENSVVSGAFSPDGLRVLTASSDRTARVWFAETGRELAGLRGHTGAVVSAVFSPDGRRVVTASEDHTARVWDTVTGRELAVLRGHTGEVASAAFSPDGRRVVTASHDGTARVWDADPGEGRAVEVPRAGDTGPSLADAYWVSDDGRWVATAPAYDVEVWDAETGRRRAVLRGHTDNVRRASFSADLRRVATTSEDGTIRVWEAGTGEQVAVVREAGIARGVCAALTRGGDRVAVVGGDGTLRVRSLPGGEELARVEGPLRAEGPRFASAAFSPDGRWAALVLKAGPVPVPVVRDKDGRLINAETGEPLGLSGAVEVPRTESMVRVLDLDTGRERTVRAEPGTEFVAARFLPGGRLATTSTDGTTRVWDAETAGLLARVDGLSAGASSFSSDGRAASVRGAGEVWVWDTRTGRQLAVIRDHAGEVKSAAISPDGGRVVTASSAGAVRVWDAGTGRLMLTVQGSGGPTGGFRPDGSAGVAFTADGTRVVTTRESGGVNHPGLVKVYDARPVNRAFVPLPVAPPPRAGGR